MKNTLNWLGTILKYTILLYLASMIIITGITPAILLIMDKGILTYLIILVMISVAYKAYFVDKIQGNQ